METKNLLYDIDIERNLIGSIMCYTQALNKVRDLLQIEVFSEPLHQQVYTAALNLDGKGEVIDTISVLDELRRMGVCNEHAPYELTRLLSCSTPNFYRSAQILFELFSRRRSWEIGQRLITRSTDLTFDLSSTIEEAVTALGDVFSTPASSIVTMREAMADLCKNHIERNLEESFELTGAPTGISQFDQKSGGLHPGNFVVVAAETSQGKTSFALSIAINAAKHDYGIAIYSLEMGNAELAARVAATESELPVNRILYSRLLQPELDVLSDGMKKLVDLPVYFDDKSTSNIDIIISSIRTMVTRHRIKGVVIDYLQILNVNMRGVNKEQQMADVARRLKNLAKDLGIWIIALSQLNRDQHNHVPSLNRLRDSGQIAEAADIVILLYRPAVHKAHYPDPFKAVKTEGTAMVDIAKGRNIGLRRFIAGFDPSTTHFYTIDDLEENEEDFEREPTKKKEEEQPF